MRGTTADNAPRGDGLCGCGCGNPAPIAKRTTASRGRYKGQPLRFIQGHNSRGMDRSGARTTHYVQEDRGYVTPCWIWQLRKTQATHRSPGGYGKMRNKGKEWLAHRWYYEQAKGPIPAGLQIDHLCFQPDCVNPDHMEPVTALENTRRNRGTKLHPEQARELERLARAGEVPQAELAERFGVSRSTVVLIKKNGADGPRRG